MVKLTGIDFVLEVELLFGVFMEELDSVFIVPCVLTLEDQKFGSTKFFGKRNFDAVIFVAFLPCGVVFYWYQSFIRVNMTD